VFNDNDYICMSQFVLFKGNWVYCLLYYRSSINKNTNDIMSRLFFLFRRNFSGTIFIIVNFNLMRTMNSFVLRELFGIQGT